MSIDKRIVFLDLTPYSLATRRWDSGRYKSMMLKPAEFIRRFKRGAERRPRTAERRRDLVFEVEIAAPPHRHVGLLDAECIGLVHEPGGQDALHRSCSLENYRALVRRPQAQRKSAHEYR